MRLSYCQFSASCYWIINLPYFTSIWGSWWTARWAWWAVCPSSKGGNSTGDMISEGVQSAGGGRQLFSSIQKLGAREEHCVKPWASHCEKNRTDILEVSLPEGCRDKEGSGTHRIWEATEVLREMCVQFGEKKCSGCCWQLGNGKIQRSWSRILVRGT